MIVFKAFLKVLRAHLFPIIIFTGFLVLFTVFNISSSDNSIPDFSDSKVRIAIINKDEEVGITKTLIDYLNANTEVVKIKDDKDSLDDALFYREINYVVEIPANYRNNILNDRPVKLIVKGTKTYQASLAEVILNRFTKVLNSYNQVYDKESEIIELVNETLTFKPIAQITSHINNDKLEKVNFYYNFINYSLLAGCVYVICVILVSFKEKGVLKRILISGMKYQTHNRYLLFANALLTFFLWLIYVLLSILLLGDVMFTSNGLFYILNSFIFSICALSIAFLIGSLIKNKNSITGIINVVALGSSFLCGAFVPMEYLPDSLIKVVHILPSYWYIKTNETLKTMELFNVSTITPLINGMLIMLAFSLFFIIVTKFISKVNKQPI